MNTGGASSVTPSITIDPASSGISIQATTLSTAEMPAHAHNIWDKQTLDWTAETRTVYNTDINVTSKNESHYTQLLSNKIGIQNTGSSGGHTHSITDSTHNHTATVDATSVLPSYYTLVFCVKVL